MAKLHELLAVEGDLKAQAQRAAGEAKGLFQDGQGKFLGQTIVHRPANEGDEQLPSKVTHVATTVDVELAAAAVRFARWMDAAIQKEETNQSTRAALAIGGDEVALSATSLLNLEAKLLELRTLYRTLPTNDVTTPWEFDEATGYYVSEPEFRRSTKKVMRSHVAYEATKEHPAQTETYHEDVLAGHITITKQSGMITPTEKRARLERLEELFQAVKRARQRANDIEVKEINIGQRILAHINGE